MIEPRRSPCRARAPRWIAFAPGLALALAVTAPAHAARLSKDVHPTSIAVALDLDPARPDYSGTVTAEIETSAPVERFRMHGRELTVTRAALRGASGVVAARSEKTGNDQITVVPASTLAPGRYTLTLEFHNNYSRRAAALYRVETRGHSYLFTQFEATEAREAFPCWDEPEFKIPWQLTLAVPATDLAISNTPVEKETSAGGKRTVVFRRTRPLPSYLIAIAVGPFDTVPIPGMSVPGRIVGPRGSAAMAAEAAQVTPPILAALERYFGRPYPYEKLDLIAAPEFLYGAMENAGAVVFADRRLLIDPRGASAANRRALRSVIAHELAHMWFGDLVTMRWWDDLWLNESFASWMGTKVMDEVFPEFRDGQSAMDGRYRAMSTDARLSTGAMRQPIESEDNLSANANELTYSKGRAVLCMFEGWLGAERFRSGVIEYLAKHEWGNATGGDLWSAISHASGDNIDPAMSSFLDQPGVPLVTIEPLASGRVRLRQQRFLSSGEAPARPTLWRVPVVLGYPDGNATRTHRAWLDKAEMEVALEGGTRPAWLLPNSGATAYYVWSVPLEMLSAIARDRGRLSPAERVGYVRNLIALQSAGRIPVERFLPLLNAFRDDPEPEVAAAVVAALEAIREPLVSPELEPLFAQQVRQLLQPALERMGREPRAKELPAASLTRPKLLRALGDMGRDPETNAWAEATTRRILDKTAVDASLADAALPLSANHGDLQLETRFRERFESATDPGERSRFLEALGAFRDPARVQELLDYSLSATMRPQEVITLPTQLAEWPGNRDALYRWLTGHYDAVSHRIPSHMFVRMMPIVRGCSSERMADARTFFANPEHTFPGASFVMARTADAVGDCVRIAERDRARFAEYLRGTARTP